MALVFRIAANSGGGGGGSYITPFAYYDFETSGSQYVTNVLGANNYTGSFNKSTGGQSYSTHFGFDDTYIHSGSYAVRFPMSTSDYTIDVGTPNERDNWNTLFSGSFSWSGWVYLERNETYRYATTSLWGLDRGSSNGGFDFTLDRSGTGFGPLAVLSYGSDVGDDGTSQQFKGWVDETNNLNYQGWNHVVFIVDGDNSDSSNNRRIRAYVNNVDYGYLDDQTGHSGVYFQHSWNPSRETYIGKRTGGGPYALDEVSIWSTALSTGQVNALYNSGNGANALTALTSSS
jgi:hypothetical protein